MNGLSDKSVTIRVAYPLGRTRPADTSNSGVQIAPRAQCGWCIKGLIRQANGNPRSKGGPYEHDAVG